MDPTDISQYAATAEIVQRQSEHNTTSLFQRQDVTTKDDCDNCAVVILGGPVVPTPVQGDRSYTVMLSSTRMDPAAAVTSQVVHFRPIEIDIQLTHLAQASYGGREFIPSYNFHSSLGFIDAYVVDFIPGYSFYQVGRQLLALNDPQNRLRRTVEDLARFFASSWTNRPNIWVPPADQLTEYQTKISQLAQSFPAHFQPKLDEIRRGLPSLFSRGYPMALQHNNLVADNIHINTSTGAITGITGWSDMNLINAPFGATFCALEAVLGVETRGCWRFHRDHVELRDHFMKTLYAEIGEGNISDDDRSSIVIARLYGLFVLFPPFRRHFLILGNTRKSFLEEMCRDHEVLKQSQGDEDGGAKLEA